MNKKQALYFISKCLTIAQFPERKKEVIQQIESGKVSWENIVKVSSGHLVLPALYLNLKRADILNLLPQDLVKYFAEITELNRERNLKILKQAKNINAVLAKHNINPIFLKGTAHIIENLYHDIAERMVGDIDFIVDITQIDDAAKILIAEGYYILYGEFMTDKNIGRHYSRLVHNDEIAAAEIHWRIVSSQKNNDLDYKVIEETKIVADKLFVPSYKIQALHNILNTQINDKGFLYGKIMLRQLYDGYLLSFKPKILEAFKKYPYNFYLKNVYLYLIKNIFKTEHITFEKSFVLNLMMNRYYFRLNFSIINGIIYTITVVSSLIFRFFKILFLAIFKKEYRNLIYVRISNSSWYGLLFKSYFG